MVSPAGTIPASGKAVDFTEVAMLRIVDGKVAKSWYWTDMIGAADPGRASIAATPGARG